MEIVLTLDLRVLGLIGLQAFLAIIPCGIHGDQVIAAVVHDPDIGASILVKEVRHRGAVMASEYLTLMSVSTKIDGNSGRFEQLA